MDYYKDKALLKELLSIKRKGRPRLRCPKWYAEGIEQADYAYQTNTGWTLSKRGHAILEQ